jgi:O-antigen ligase
MEAYAASEGTGSIGKQIGVIVLFLYGSFACFFTHKKILNFDSLQLKLGAAFLILITVSISWSAAPTASLARWTGFVAYTLAALGATKRLSALDVIRWYVFAHFFYLVTGLVDEIVLGTFTPFAGAYRFAGLNLPNNAGTDAAMLVFSSIAMLRVKPASRVYIFTLVTAVSFLLLTRSRTSLLSTAFALILFYGFVTVRSNRLMPYLCLLGTVVSVSLFVSSQDIDVKGALSMGRAEAAESTLTGRVPLWTELYEQYILKRPVLGYGYGGFWTPEQSKIISSDQDWIIGSAHSIYIDAALTLGLGGLFLYLATLVSVLFRAVREARLGQQDGFFFGCLILGALFDGFSDSGPWFISSIYLFGCIQALIAVSSIGDIFLGGRRRKMEVPYDTHIGIAKTY